MIIELFGPAGSGKTTLARAAAEALRRRGHSVRVASSARPSERIAPGSGKPTGFVTPVRSLIARSGKAVDIAPLLRALSGGRSQTVGLFRPLLTNMGALGRLRFLRYLARLDQTWADARSSRDIVIFDQGYVSALGVVFLENGSCLPEALREVLREAPFPDLMIHVCGPPEVIEERLKARLAGQSWLERFLELDPAKSKQEPGVFTLLAAMLADQGRPPTTLSSANPAELLQSAGAIVRLVENSFGAATSIPEGRGIGCEHADSAELKARLS